MTRIIECAVIVLLTLQLINSHRILETDPKYGVNIEVMDDPLFYNTFVPLIYEFQLPQWKASDLRMKWPSGNSNQCDRSDAWNWSWDRQACPVVYHYNALIDSLLKNMTEIWKENIFERKSYLNTRWSLKEIVPHFAGSSVNETELDNYLKYFGRSSFAKPIVTKNIGTKKDVNVDVYERMLANFREKSMFGIASEGTQTINSPLLYIQYAVLTNSYTAIQAMQILNFYMARNEWVHAFSSCKNYQIPENLVTKSMLLKSLAQIRKQLSEFHKIKYRLTISPDELSTYYHLQLTDCTFTTTNKFIVRILVPIRNVDSEEILIKVNTIPFFRQIGDRTEICEVANVEAEYIARDDKMNMIQTNYCHLNDVCKIPDRSEWFLPNSCFSAIVANNETEIDEFCFMDCRIYSESNGPYFKQISTDRYAIAGSLSEKGEDAFILLSCSRSPHQMIKGEHYGAVIVTLPCDCKLIYELDTLTITGECNNKTLTIESSIHTHVIPYLWETKDEVDTIDSEHTDFSDADLDDTNFAGKDLEDTDLEDTDLEDTDLEDTDLEDTDLEDTDLEDTDLVEIIDIALYTSPPITISTTAEPTTDSSSIEDEEERFVETFETLNTSTDLNVSELQFEVYRLTNFMIILFALMAIQFFVAICYCIKIKMLHREILRSLIPEIQCRCNSDSENCISQAISIQNTAGTSGESIQTRPIYPIYPQ